MSKIKLAALYYDRERANEKYLAEVKKYLPDGTTIYLQHGSFDPKPSTVTSVQMLGDKLRICTYNPRTKKGRWIGLGEIMGLSEPGQKSVYDMARALKLA